MEESKEKNGRGRRRIERRQVIHGAPRISKSGSRFGLVLQTMGGVVGIFATIAMFIVGFRSCEDSFRLHPVKNQGVGGVVNDSIGKNR